jgi:hypothetical protein
MKLFRASCFGIATATLLLLCGSAGGDETKRKITTFVAAGSLDDRGAQIEKQVIEECIVSLPNEGDLEPTVDVKSKYMKSIAGDPQANGSVRTYTAELTVPYLVQRKHLVIVTTNSVEKSEPVIKEVSGRFEDAKTFASNPENGDQYAGRGLVNEYYFSNEALAVEDAMRRAKAWLKQKRSVMCTN